MASGGCCENASRAARKAHEMHGDRQTRRLLMIGGRKASRTDIHVERNIESCLRQLRVRW
jgi:hypothetical protein